VTHPEGESWVGFDAVPLAFATESFTFTMFEGISCTFLAEQVFMLQNAARQKSELILQASASKPLMDLR
jgi:hypothetical protein